MSAVCTAQTLNMRVTTANWATTANVANSATTAKYLSPTPSILVTSNYTGVVTINSQLNAPLINGRITYNATYWDDMTVDLQRSIKLGVTDPEWGAWRGGNIYTYHFDDTRDEELAFSIQMSHQYKHGTTMNLHVHYSPDTTATGNVVWGIGYTMGCINDTMNAEVIVTAAATIASPSQYKHLLIDITNNIPSCNNPSAVIFGRVFRNGSSSNDTLTGDCSGLSLDIHYQKDSPGSRGIITK